MDQRTEFKKDILDFFGRKRGGHVERWFHLGTAPDGMTDTDLYGAFLRASKNYYILPNEVALIEHIADKLANRIGRFDTLLDIGVGPKPSVRRKILPLAAKFKDGDTYGPVDISQEYIDGSDEVVREHTRLKVRPIRGDFFRDALVFPGKNRLAAFFGATASNQNALEGEDFPRQSIVQKLAHIRSLLDNGHENLLLASFDSNADPHSIIRAYDDIHWKRFVANLAYSIHQVLDVEGNFRPSAWHYEPVWDEKAKVLHHMLVASEDQEFAIDGIPFEIKKGERFIAINSFKFPVKWFQSMAREAGFETESPFIDPQGRMVIQPLSVA